MNKWGYYILIIVQNRCHSENQFPSDQREFAILKKGKRNLLMSLVIKKNLICFNLLSLKALWESTLPSTLFDGLSFSKSWFIFLGTTSRCWKPLTREETCQHAVLQELKWSKRRPYTKAAKGLTRLTSILLMLLSVVLKQEKLEFSSSPCPSLSNINISSLQRT